MSCLVELLPPRAGAVAARVVVGSQEREIGFACADPGPLASGADPFVAAALLPAMRHGEPMQVRGTLSPRLAASLPRIQAIFHRWSEAHRPIEIRAQTRPPATAAGDGVACFFSGGVDSCYSLLQNRPAITHLVLVVGFDVRREDQALRERVVAEGREVAERFGKQLVELETSARRLEPLLAPWWFTHGTILAGALLALAPRYRRILVPASHSYAGLFPWGSHPLLDPLWSTEQIEVIHDGCEASRFEKVARIAQDDFLLGRLRVCHASIRGHFNCGRCDKCVRTMASLTILGALSRASFEAPLDLDRVERAWLGEPNTRLFAQENLRAALERGADPRLVRALRRCLAGRHHKGWRRHAHALRTRWRALKGELWS
jgi:hypothetical protein